ncbi:AraC-like ligand-binding domain-containing protein [Micrococcoides hystricis]|uniref:Helix-turn-helix domain-containing protein n=1 Tax=Micrococcoides hystricis TaxID=1572761 RepID=A0ABV6P6M7_9MICC
MYQEQTVDNFAQWRQLVSNAFVPLETTTDIHDQFRATIAGQQFNEIALLKVQAPQHSVMRTQDQIDREDKSYYKLNLQLAGQGFLAQYGRSATLRPGDLALYDTGEPYTLEFDEDFSTLVLMFPKDGLGIPAADIKQLAAVRLAGEQRLARAISPFVAELGQQLPELSSPLGARLAQNVVDLMTTFLADELYQGHAPVDEQTKLLAEVRDFIDQQLPNPELSPAVIAAAHFMSVRSLHKLFSETGSTVSEWIRSRRLERCRQDLADPLLAHLPVGAIGARWGLSDAAHFSRSFRSAYNCSPSAYRATGVTTAA